MEFNFIHFLYYLKLIIGLFSLVIGFFIIVPTLANILFNEEKFIFKKHFKNVVIALILFTLSAFLFSIEIIK